MAHFEAAAHVPTLLAISPNGPYGVQDLWAAGGMPAVLKQMQGFLDTSTMTVTGKPLQDTIDKARVLNDSVIPPVEKAFRPSGGISVLRGNLAPDTAIIKQSGVSLEMLKTSGPAICFNSENDAMIAIKAGKIHSNHVVVLRYMGPQGAPGMPEMLGATIELKMAGLKKAALITDGRFSGATSGPCVGHICPEASKGGPIALIEDGDIIEIDIPNNSLNLQVDEATLSRRRENWVPHEGAVAHGYMRLYRKYVRPACEGAVLD
jgi:dihydroxy-acid dehydratase